MSARTALTNPTALETSDGTVHFRGDGLFLGWGAEEMGSAWDALARSDSPPEPELMQLG